MTIKTLLMGGVGNQLFQLARAVSIKLEGRDVTLIKVVFLKKYIYTIIGHPIQKQWIDIDILAKNLGIKVLPLSFNLTFKIFFLFILKKFKFSFFFDTPLRDKLNSKILIDIGYFQDPAHLNKNSLHFVLNEFSKIIPLKPLNRSKKTISFHIRGGDFFDDDKKIIFKRPNMKKINRLIKYFLNIDYKIHVISDDKRIPSMLKIENDDISFINHSPLEDFLEISVSKILYPSQSTFCFWAYAIALKDHNCRLIEKNNWIFNNFINKGYIYHEKLDNKYNKL